MLSSPQDGEPMELWVGDRSKFGRRVVDEPYAAERTAVVVGAVRLETMCD